MGHAPPAARRSRWSIVVASPALRPSGGHVPPRLPAGGTGRGVLTRDNAMWPMVPRGVAQPVRRACATSRKGIGGAARLGETGPCQLSSTPCRRTASSSHSARRGGPGVPGRGARQQPQGADSVARLIDDIKAPSDSALACARPPLDGGDRRRGLAGGSQDRPIPSRTKRRPIRILSILLRNRGSAAGVRPIAKKGSFGTTATPW